MQYLKTSEVVAMCRISRRTLYDWLKQGKFPAPIIFNKRVRRWREDVVLEWMAGQ